MSMDAYFELQPDIFAEYVPRIVSTLPNAISFIDGTVIADQLPAPLVFSTGHSMQDPPKGMHGEVIPILSAEFIAALLAAGVSNLQAFPAEVRSRVDSAVWTNYQAINIVGLIACADLTASQFTRIIDRPGAAAVPLMAFEDLKVAPARARGALLFRLAESPGTILVARSVVEHLRSLRTDDDWGITLDAR